MASLARAIAVGPSGCGAPSGARAVPSVTQAGSKPSTRSFCIAHSSARAAICAMPAALPVGACSSVTWAGLTPQAAATSSERVSDGGSGPSRASTATEACSSCRMAVATSSARASRRAGPEPSSTAPPGLLKVQPAYWLPRQASAGCAVRTETAQGSGREGCSATVASPPSVTRASARPASSEPRASCPQSSRKAPAASRRTPMPHTPPSRAMARAMAAARALSERGRSMPGQVRSRSSGSLRLCGRLSQPSWTRAAGRSMSVGPPRRAAA
ncbi:hypothetical protein ruthe_02902 [Rubellimicrobium thermophilum DSM 16684]|uniref:Uncharacterized protein n=1 Tax=Rubellimicrobium thermophilum DSM 16684 TaxID=1123069 RepID=S9QP99_9RHOB|nr:hypothetical protein ruthe_02902 [Rubellimicrobium thermophilum DSM 16684]